MIQNTEILIQGGGEAVERCKMKILIMLDEIIGNYSESIEIDPIKQPSIAGKRRSLIVEIMKETGTSIYLPPHNPSLGRTQDDLLFRKTVWITGSPNSITEAKKKLMTLEVCNRLDLYNFC